MPKHRHKFVVVRRQRCGGEPMVKVCECGRIYRHCRGRWVLTSTRKADAERELRKIGRTT